MYTSTTASGVLKGSVIMSPFHSEFYKKKRVAILYFEPKGKYIKLCNMIAITTSSTESPKEAEHISFKWLSKTLFDPENLKESGL